MFRNNCPALLWLLLFPKSRPCPGRFLAFSGGFAFLSDDVTDVTACDVMGECEQTECEAGCILSVV